MNAGLVILHAQEDEANRSRDPARRRRRGSSQSSRNLPRTSCTHLPYRRGRSPARPYPGRGSSRRRCSRYTTSRPQWLPWLCGSTAARPTSANSPAGSTSTRRQLVGDLLSWPVIGQLTISSASVWAAVTSEASYGSVSSWSRRCAIGRSRAVASAEGELGEGSTDVQHAGGFAVGQDDDVLVLAGINAVEAAPSVDPAHVLVKRPIAGTVDEPPVAVPEVGSGQAAAGTSRRRARGVNGEHLRSERGGDQRAVLDGVVPALQVGHGGVQTAVGEERRHGVGDRLTAVGVIAEGVPRPDHGGVGACVSHPERAEDVLLQEGGQRLPGEVLDQ